MKTALEHTIHESWLLESWLLESWLESESSEDGLESESRVMKQMTRLILNRQTIVWIRKNNNERIFKKNWSPLLHNNINSSLSQAKTNGAGAETYVSAGIGPDFVAGFSGSEDAAAAGFSGSEDADSVEDSVIATLRWFS